MLAQQNYWILNCTNFCVEISVLRKKFHNLVKKVHKNSSQITASLCREVAYLDDTYGSKNFSNSH